MALGLALSGGGIRGASHIGALRALEEAGLKPKMIAGSSAGSIVASMYATGMTVDEMEESFLRYAPYVLDIDFAGALGALLRLCSLFRGKPVLSGLIKGSNAEKIIYNLTGGRAMAQADIPLAITATDINDGTPIVLLQKGWTGGRRGTRFFAAVSLSARRSGQALPYRWCFGPRRWR